MRYFSWQATEPSSTAIWNICELSEALEEDEIGDSDEEYHRLDAKILCISEILMKDPDKINCMTYFLKCNKAKSI